MQSNQEHRNASESHETRGYTAVMEHQHADSQMNINNHHHNHNSYGNNNYNSNNNHHTNSNNTSNNGYLNNSHIPMGNEEVMNDDWFNEFSYLSEEQYMDPSNVTSHGNSHHVNMNMHSHAHSYGNYPPYNVPNNISRSNSHQIYDNSNYNYNNNNNINGNMNNSSSHYQSIPNSNVYYAQQNRPFPNFIHPTELQKQLNTKLTNSNNNMNNNNNNNNSIQVPITRIGPTSSSNNNNLSNDRSPPQSSSGHSVNSQNSGSSDSKSESRRDSTDGSKVAEKKRQDRNSREQQRSFKISRQIDELKSLLEDSGFQVKNSKYDILAGVTAYVKQLQVSCSHAKLCV